MTEKLSLKILEDYLFDRYENLRTEQNLFMKLVEEIGEVAEVLNKRAGIKKSSDEDLTNELANELADVIHYVVGIAAINKIDLSKVILEKDKVASIKYEHTINLEDFIEKYGEK